jgi:precorrin-2 dehydrogenase / sirohydrochlorin ferrochelatase
MIPLFVDCSGRRVVIFGGGEVAFRKARNFLPEADVSVFSRSFIKKFADLPAEKLKLDVKSATDEEISSILSGSFVVVAALSDPDQNNRIGRLCREQLILFNNADGDTGNVIVPSVSRGEHYTLAISTGGSSPAVSRFIREHFESEFPALDAMIALQKELREELKKKEPSQPKRNAVLHEVLHDDAVWRALESDPAAAGKKVFRKYLHG